MIASSLRKVIVARTVTNDKGNAVSVWRMADLHNAELLKGDYGRHSYPWHSHEELSLGLVLGGGIRLQTRAREGIATAGSFVLINSDEVHQGSPVSADGWRCRTIHVTPKLVQAIADETRCPGHTADAADIAFNGPTFDDSALARAFLELHQLSENGGSTLDRQSRIVAIIGHLLRFHRRSGAASPVFGNETAAVDRAREYLDEHLTDKVTLDELALASDLPPFRLLRAFRRAIGLTPHNYQLQSRVRKAHKLIIRGDALADVSLAVGFSDQPHLTRVFKSMMGGTPGQFRAAFLAD